MTIAFVLGGIGYFVMMIIDAVLLIKRWVRDPLSDWHDEDDLGRFMCFIGAMLLSLGWPLIFLFLLVDGISQREIAKREQEKRNRKELKRKELLEIATQLQIWIPLTKSMDLTEKEIAQDMVASLRARKKELS